MTTEIDTMRTHGRNTRMRRTIPLLAPLLIAIGITGCSRTTSDVASEQTSVNREDDAKPESDEVRILGTLPDFALTEQSGVKVDLAAFRGRVWIANFMFTRCLGTCPTQTAKLVRLQDLLRRYSEWNDIRLVSFTVDPEFDTPEVLASYSQTHRADSEHWKFLTGPREAIWKLSKDGFKLPVGEDPKTTRMPIFHSPQFILVDRVGRIRGYYDSGEKDVIGKLMDSIEVVLGEPFPDDEVAISADPGPV
jgi:cytochrome oxidase Cu insertion factor (SCO1/SenC/PrrC family)